MEDKWKQRSKTLANGRVIRWKERSLGDGEVERVYETEGQFRDSDPAPVTLRSS